jgi:hypothetical protein
MASVISAVFTGPSAATGPTDAATTLTILSPVYNETRTLTAHTYLTIYNETRTTALTKSVQAETVTSTLNVTITSWVMESSTLTVFIAYATTTLPLYTVLFLTEVTRVESYATATSTETVEGKTIAYAYTVAATATVRTTQLIPLYLDTQTRVIRMRTSTEEASSSGQTQFLLTAAAFLGLILAIFHFYRLRLRWTTPAVSKSQCEVNLLGPIAL